MKTNMFKNLFAVVSAILMLSLVGCGFSAGDADSNNSTGSAPPVLIGFSPTATNITLNSVIKANFDQAVDPATVGTGNFKVTTGNIQIGGLVTVSTDKKTVIFTPTALLAANVVYTVSIGGVKNSAGNISADYSWTFTTGTVSGDTTPPTAIINPANGATNVALATTIIATFSEPVDSSTVNTNTFKLLAGSTPIASNVVLVGNIATLTPANALSAGTTYTASLNGIKDSSGNLIVQTSQNFTTVSPDSIPPTAILTPANGSINVPVTTVITATFSEAVDTTTVNANTFKLMAGSTPIADNVVLVGNIATLTPVNTLTAGTIYTVSLNGAKDLSGNLIVQISQNFTTVPNANSAILNLADAYFYSNPNVTNPAPTPTILGQIKVNTADRDWYVSESWGNQSVVAGGIYRVTFNCASVPVSNIGVQYKQELAPNNALGSAIVACNGAVSTDITVSSSDANARLYLNFGANAATYTLGTVTVQKIN